MDKLPRGLTADKILALVLVLFMTASGAFPQEKPANPASPVVAVVPDYSKESVVYEKVRGHMRYEADGSGSLITYAKIRVQTYAGVQQLGQLIFNYDSATATLDVHLVRVTKPDGKIVDAGPDAIQDMTSPVARSAPMYTDLHQKHVVVPNLSPGDILEYETRVDSRPLTPGKFWQIWSLISANICLDEQVELNVPTAVQVKTVTVGASAPQVREDGGRTISVWTTSHLTRDEPIAQTTNTGSPFPDVKTLLVGSQPQDKSQQIWITSFADWAEISAWYAVLEREKRVPAADVRAKAEELTKNLSTNLDKTTAIYNYVAHNIRYVSLSFGLGRYQPHSASEVLTHQYGDCKDKATLLESMLDAVGIKASPVLLRSVSHMNEEIPSPAEFDHVITYVTFDAKEYWLDSTLGVAPFGYLLPNVRGKKALIASPEKGSELRRIPADLPFPSSYSLNLDGNVDDEKNMKLKVVFETRGDWEILFRLALLRSSITDLQSLIETQANQTEKSDNFSISDLTASDPYQTSAPFLISLQMTSDLSDVNEKSKIGKKSAPSIADGMPLKPEDFDSLLEVLLPSSNDGRSVKLGAPKQTALTLKISVSEKIVTSFTKAIKSSDVFPFHVSSSFADYEQSWSWNGKEFDASLNLHTKVSDIPKDQIEEYSKFRSSLLAQWSEVAYAMGAPRPVMDSPGKAVMRYSEALADMKAGKWNDARSALQSVIHEQPNYTDAWRSLGDLEAGQGNWTDADKAYSKLCQIAPTDYSGYSGLIRGYMARQMYDEAISTAKRELLHIPNGPDGHQNLGSIYLRTEKFSLAAKEYESAAKLLPDNVAVQISLGEAYAGEQNKIKAKEAFDRAEALDPSDSTLNDIAYYGAEAGLDLSVAERRSLRSVVGVEKQLNAVKLEDISLSTTFLLSRMAAYWDTLGWIKFKRGDLPGAEKYLLAATDLTDAPEIQMHMGRIQEALGRKDAAMRCYVSALQGTQVVYFVKASGGKMVPGPAHTLTPPEREAKAHLAALAGSPAEVEDQMKEGSYNRNVQRTVAIPNPHATEKQERLAVLLKPGPKISSSSILSESEAKSELLERFADKVPPQTFPDETVSSIPRLAGIKCMTNPLQCEFEFFPTGTAFSLLPQTAASAK